MLYEQNASVPHASLHFVDDTCLQVGCLLFLVEMLCSNFDSNFLFFSRSEVHIGSDEQACEPFFRAENPHIAKCVSARNS